MWGDLSGIYAFSSGGAQGVGTMTCLRDQRCQVQECVRRAVSLKLGGPTDVCSEAGILLILILLIQSKAPSFL